MSILYIGAGFDTSILEYYSNKTFVLSILNLFLNTET